MFGTKPARTIGAISAAVALLLGFAACGTSEEVAPQNPWSALAAAYPSLAGAEGLVVPTMEPDGSTAGVLYQSAYGRAALRNAGRLDEAVADAKLLESVDETAAREPIWTAFQLCLATGGSGSPDLLEDFSADLGSDVRDLAVRSIVANDDEAGYSAQVLSCFDPGTLKAHAAQVRGTAENDGATSYQRYLAVRALDAAGLTVTVDARSLPALPSVVDCTDPAAASDWMAVHQLHRRADAEFYRPQLLVDCAAEVGSRVNAQSALAAVVVADRSPAQLQKLSMPVLDPLAQQIDGDGLILPVPPGGLRWTLRYAAALSAADVDVPAALTRAVQDQIDMPTEREDRGRDGLLAGLCAVERQLHCPADVIDSGRGWVGDLDFADVEVNVFTWMDMVLLAQVLDIDPGSGPATEQAEAFATEYSAELAEYTGVVEGLITVAASAGMDALVDALRPLADPAATFFAAKANGPLTAMANAYTAAEVLGIDTVGWLDDLDAVLLSFAVNEVSGFPYSQTPQPAAADSSASLAAAALIAARG